jgi:leader peptidase (prepilin peptidase) / N-methyltransferase
VITAYFLTMAFLVGACVGSFLNVCIARWPRELSVVRPGSRCPSCGHRLRWYENIPLASWIALRGRCRCCREPISIQYPAVELAVALGWLAAFWHFGLGLEALRVAVFGSILLGIAITDARHYLIPDGFTLFGLLWVLAMSLVGFFLAEPSRFATPYDALLGACAGAGMIAIVGWLGEVALRREAMGLGDVTLMAFVGAAVGPVRSLATVFVGATLAAVVFLGVVYPVIAWTRRTKPHRRVPQQTELALGARNGSAAAPLDAPLVPFGVFLAPAAMVTLLWGDALLSWITRP